MHTRIGAMDAIDGGPFDTVGKNCEKKPRREWPILLLPFPDPRRPPVTLVASHSLAGVSLCPLAASKLVLKKPLQITKVVRPVAAEEAPVVEMTWEEQRDAFVAKYGPLRSGIRHLAPAASFEAVLEQLVVPHAAECCAAFDFDQTLHLREAHRGHAGAFLARLQALGIPYCIVTAAQPRVSSVKALAQELAELRMDHLFRTTLLPRERALDVLRAWGPGEALSAEALQKKLVLLFALLTDRRPSDLARVGYSQVHVAADGASATYKLQRSATEWSAELTLEARPSDPLVCPVVCLKDYLGRIGKVRQPPVYRVIDPEVDFPDNIVEDDALFLQPDGQRFSPTSLEHVVEHFLLQEGHFPEWQVAGLLREAAVELTVDGIQMARFGNLIAAKYNKAQAVQWFVKEQQERGHACKRILFVDDNMDNVFGVFGFFASREAAAPDTSVFSVWFEPPAEGNPEKQDEHQAK